MKAFRNLRDGLHLLAHRRRADCLAALAQMEAEGTDQTALAALIRLNLAIADLVAGATEPPSR